MKLMISILFFTAFIVINAKEIDDKVIATVGSEEITYGQIQSAYEKNLSREEKRLFKLPQDSLNNFLNLYIDYRLKVLDAIDKGYLQDSVVMKEINSNRRMLAESFFFDRYMMGPKLDEIMARRKWDLKFAYIIVSKQQDGKNDPTTAPLRAKECLAKAQKGEDFGSLAKEYSSDSKSREQDGVVEQYITGARIQKPLEDALYGLKVGEVNEKLIETSYGFFIIKLLEKKDRHLRRARHILIGSVGGYKSDDSLSMQKTADSLYSLLKNGSDFATLAKENSGDDETKVNGGLFEEFYSRSTGQEKSRTPLIAGFEKIMFDLEKGEISSPLWTNYGVHIITIDGIKEPDFSEEYKSVKKLYKRIYYATDKENYTDSLSAAFGFEIISNNLDQFLSKVDTNKTNLGKEWDKNIDKSDRKLILFKFNKNDYSIAQFINNSNEISKLRGFALNREGIEKACMKLIDDELFSVASFDLEKDVPEFSTLLSEFRDGIILFKAEDEEVWQKKKFDSTLARIYFDSTSTKYMTNYVYDMSELFLITKRDADDAFKELTGGADFDSLTALKTQRSNFREKKGYMGKLDTKRDKVAALVDPSIAALGKLFGPLESGKGYSIIKIHSIEHPRQKTFNEAFQDIAPKVQDILQNNLRRAWLDRIKKKHEIKINKSNIEKIFQYSKTQ
jgi:peptidyl-prolyl cis-trans isomerase SurA